VLAKLDYVSHNLVIATSKGERNERRKVHDLDHPKGRLDSARTLPGLHISRNHRGETLQICRSQVAALTRIIDPESFQQQQAGLRDYRN